MVTRKKSDCVATCSRTTSSASARPPQPAPLAKPASCRFKSAVLYVPHLNAVAAPALHNSNNVHHVDLEAQRRAEEDRAFQAVKSMEKHHVQNGKKNQKHHEYDQYEYHKGHSGSRKQRGSSQRHRQQQHGQQASASKPQPIEERTVRGYDRRMIDDVLGNGPATTQSSPERGKSGKDHKGVSKRAVDSTCLHDTNKVQTKKAKSLEQPQVQHLLLPQSETGKSRAEVNDRKKHPRLAGADLYVTRLGWNNNNIAQPNPKKKFVKPSARDVAPPSSSESEMEPPSLPSSASSTCTLGNTGSLYDELRSSAPKTTPPIPEKAPTVPREAIHASRPCYRCVSYMHAVGIKRVFWTNDDGEWEGGKVARFIDALDGEVDGAGCDGGPMGNGVFVTKHEVLMMRRKMGD